MDTSPVMLEQARAKAAAAGLGHRLHLVQASITRVQEELAGRRFDIITATVVLGQFGEHSLRHILAQCHHLLDDGGRLIIADEVLPAAWLPRLAYRAGLALLWIPQFLILRHVSLPFAHLSRYIEAAGFTITTVRSWRLGSFQLIIAKKAAPPESA